jgi:hypothetical protein
VTRDIIIIVIIVIVVIVIIIIIIIIIILSKCREKTGGEFKLKPKSNNNYDRPWKYFFIFTPIKFIGNAECPCKHGIQTVGRLIFQCSRLKNERVTLKNSVFKAGDWSMSKCELINKYFKQFTSYINSMDLEKI